MEVFLHNSFRRENLVTLVRVRSNRIFYRQFIPEISESKNSGHPRWYGDKFDLSDSTTWHQPDDFIQATFTTGKGRELNLKISAWHQMLMRGTSHYAMHKYPFTLLQIQVSDHTGETLWKPMWLIVIGRRRHELTLRECYQAYRQRYDLEHLFRFGKQRLLFNAYSTPEVFHEENWFQLTLLAYVNLWKARNLAQVLPRPWENYLSQNSQVYLTPSLVQRDFYRIISTIGTPASSPKPRGYSSGRILGDKRVPRTRHPVLKKQSKSQNRKRPKKMKPP
ncbi:MAG: transposase [Symploca sp. SIO2B6]|nr:transposase [Symploca sp. SIO2B6]